jgi:hypothetical protein
VERNDGIEDLVAGKENSNKELISIQAYPLRTQKSE